MRAIHGSIETLVIVRGVALATLTSADATAGRQDEVAVGGPPWPSGHSFSAMQRLAKRHRVPHVNGTCL
jgi:hypothetical protein